MLARFFSLWLLFNGRLQCKATATHAKRKDRSTNLAVSMDSSYRALTTPREPCAESGMAQPAFMVMSAIASQGQALPELVECRV